DCAMQDCIVSFSTSRGKKNLSGSAMQELSYFLPGGFYGSARFSPMGMCRRGIPKVLKQERLHRLEDFRIERCCCCIVQVYTHRRLFLQLLGDDLFDVGDNLFCKVICLRL